MKKQMLMFLTYTTTQKQCPEQKQTFGNVKNYKEMVEFLKLKAMHHNIIVLQVLERIFNVTFPTAVLYTLSNTWETHNIPLFSWNISGETPVHTACIKNDVLKLGQLLKVPGLYTYSFNTSSSLLLCS